MIALMIWNKKHHLVQNILLPGKFMVKKFDLLTVLNKINSKKVKSRKIVQDVIMNQPIANLSNNVDTLV